MFFTSVYDCQLLSRKRKLTPPQKHKAIKRRDKGREMLPSIVTLTHRNFDQHARRGIGSGVRRLRRTVHTLRIGRARVHRLPRPVGNGMVA